MFPISRNRLLLIMVPCILLIGGAFAAPVAKAVAVSSTDEYTERAAAATVPAGFNEVMSDTGVVLYKKDSFNGVGHRAFVQAVSLNRGASLKLLYGETTDLGEPSRYGRANPRFERTRILPAWKEFSESTPGAFCIVNGAFFNQNMDPAHLSFPLKVDGEYVSGGGDSSSVYDGKLLMLEIWPSKADIRPLDPLQKPWQSGAPNVLVGLVENFPKRAAESIGRTFVGIDDRDGNGTYETILIFTTDFATQKPDNHAAIVLRGFGADKVIMFDGSGSSQLQCLNRPLDLAGDGRELPQTIGVVKAPYEFNSEFNGTAPGWTAVNGNWIVGPANYASNGVRGLFASARHTGSYARLQYEARLKRTGCTSCANALIIRGTPQPLDSWKIWHKAYYFQYTNDGYFSVWKDNNGVQTPLQAWTYSPAIIPGGWNVLKIYAKQNVLHFFINETFVWFGTDSSFPRGAVGMAFYKDYFSFTGNRLIVDWARLSTTVPAMLDEDMPVSGVEVPGGEIFTSP